MANAAKNERLSNMFICTLSKINNNKFDLFAKDHKKKSYNKSNMRGCVLMAKKKCAYKTQINDCNLNFCIV